MKELRLVLETTKIINGHQIDVYKIGRYTIDRIVFQNGWAKITVREDGSEYLPTIYCRDDMKGNILGFEIQTTSYGSLPIDEIKKMVADIEEAVAVAEILTKEFVENNKK